MTRLRVEVVIDAPPEAVWAEIEDIASHVEWMAEAVAIRFRSPNDRGMGTEIECDTRVGPFTTTDVLRFVEWAPPRVMGIEHTGAVKGSGRFLLEPIAGTRTRFVWDEDLTFPLRLGGALGGAIGAVLLRRVWRRNLAHLKRRIESSAP